MGKCWQNWCHHYSSTRQQLVNSLAPERCVSNFEIVISNHMVRIDFLSTGYEIALKWMPQNLTNEKSTLDQVMAWCLTAPSHYLSQCWPRSMSPYAITRPQWVNEVFYSLVLYAGIHIQGYRPIHFQVQLEQLCCYYYHLNTLTIYI